MSKSHTLFQCQFPHLQNGRSNTNNTYLVGSIKGLHIGGGRREQCARIPRVLSNWLLFWSFSYNHHHHSYPMCLDQKQGPSLLEMLQYIFSLIPKHYHPAICHTE